MPTARSAVKIGPAIVQFGGATFYTKNMLKVETPKKTFLIESDAYGKIDEREDDVITELIFTPVGEWESAALSVLNPHTNPVMGTSLLGASDVPVTVHPLDGAEKIVYAAGFMSSIADIYISANKSPFGQCKITALGKNNTARSASDKFYTITDPSAFSDTSLSVANIKTVACTAALAGASSPWDAIKSKEGFTIKQTLKAKPIIVDDEGTLDFRLAGYEISVLFAPPDISLAAVLTKLSIQGSGAIRGRSLAASAANLTITGPASGDPLIVINNVALKGAPQNYGFDDLRHGNLEFVATRPSGSGTMISVGSVT